MSRALGIVLAVAVLWVVVRLLDRTPAGRRWLLRSIWVLALWNGVAAVGNLFSGQWLQMTWAAAGVWVCHRWASNVARDVRTDRALADREALEDLHRREAL